MRNHQIEAEIAALQQKIERQRKAINRVKADERYRQSARVYLDQLATKLTRLEKISENRKIV